MNASEVYVIYNIFIRRIKAPCLFLKIKEVIKGAKEARQTQPQKVSKP